MSDAQKLKAFCLSIIAENYPDFKANSMEELPPDAQEEIVDYCKK